MEIYDQIQHQSGIYVDPKTWKRMGRIYRRFPFLANINVTRTLISLFMAGFAILMATMREPCTCEDQIADERLKTRAVQGDSAVMAYMKSQDDAIICAAKRQELLKKLEQEKKLKVKQLKI